MSGGRMAHKIAVKGYVLKDGRLVKKPTYSSVSQKIKAAKSKKIRVAKPVIS
jgi:hypothetical protein